MMKKLLSFICFLMITFSMFAVPAYPGLINFIQPDGSELEIYLKGDEKVKWAETHDGYSILFNKDGFYEYAMLDENSNMVPSGVRANSENSRAQTEKSFLTTMPKKLTYNDSQVNMMKQIWNIYDKENSRAFPTTGSRKLICLLIGYTDLAFTKTQNDFNNLFNQVSYSTDGATGSVKDFYLENSYSLFNLTVDVAGPYTASNNMAYYGANDASGYDLRPRELVTEAINAADVDVNFSDYDNDSDGWVDGVYVIFAGYDESAGASANAMWAHAWSLSSALMKDGVYLQRYSCSSELRDTSGTGLSRIGVICHEFGHVLGAPDYYDTDYATGGQYQGMGDWDLMAGGSWNNSGATPAHHNGLTKVYFYNWASFNYISTGATITLNNSVENDDSFYRYETTTSNEYFFIENRQQIGFDGSIPGAGMMIYHVHSNFASGASSNIVNDTHPQMMYPVSQNATGDPTSTPSSYGSIDSSTCPWNGTGKTSFTDATSPSSKSWASANTSKPITNITRNIANQTVSFDFMGGDNSGITISIDNPSDSDYIQIGTTVNFNVSASDASKVGINRVEFFIDNMGTPVSTDYSAPYTYSWDTTSWSAGSVTLKATAYDDDTPVNTKDDIISVTLYQTVALPIVESFESAVPPANWTETIVVDQSTSPDWTRESSSTNPTCSPIDGTYLAKFNSYSCGGGGIARLSTFALNLTSATSSTVSIQMYHDTGYSSYTSEGIYIEVSTDGSSWTNIGSLIPRYDGTTGWNTHIKDISAYDGLSPVWVAITGVSQYGNNIFVDDFNVYAASPPEFAIDVVSLDFGNQEVNTTSNLQFEISNDGGSPLNGSIATPHPEYVVSEVAKGKSSKEKNDKSKLVRNSINYTINGGESKTFNLAFTPIAVSEYNGNLVITTGDPTNPNANIPVTGNGIAAEISLSTIDITQTIPVDDSATNNVIISNIGDANLNYSATIVYAKGSRDVLLNEGFENGGSIPSGWTQSIVSGTTNWTFVAGNGNSNPSSTHTGSYNALLKDSDTADDKTLLISPSIDFGTNTTNPQLTFWHYMQLWSPDQDELTVYYKTSTAGSWTLLQSYTSNISSWTEQTIPLPNPSSDYYIGFEGNAKYGYGVCIDDVLVEGNPTATWLSITPLSDSINGGEVGFLQLTFDSTGLAEGTYNATINITSNDQNSPHAIAVALTVDNTLTQTASAGSNNGGSGAAAVDVPPVEIDSATIDPDVSITPTGAVPVAVDVTVSDAPLNPVANPENVLISYRMDITGNISGNNLSGVLNYGSLSPSSIVYYDGSWKTPSNVSLLGGQATFNFTLGSKGTEVEFLLGAENPLPVTLSAFAAHHNLGTTYLTWTTQSELNNSHWNVYRSLSENIGQAQKVNSENIEGSGTTSEATDYKYYDELEQQAELTYWYWIECVDYSGNTELFAPVTITIPQQEDTPPEIPASYGLYANYPNPFNPSTQIGFALQKPANAYLSVYDVKGRLVRHLLTDEMTPAEQVIRVTWDGKDEFGKHVGSGVYFYRLKAGQKDYVRKMLLIK
jgi:M6 family metalloprotease-like protein